MSYLLQEPSTFINIKLTDVGRQMLSLGRLKFESVALSDREINYGIARDSGYEICNNRILAPKDSAPTFGGSFDGSTNVPLVGTNLASSTEIVTAMTENTGFFSGNTNGYAIIDAYVAPGYGSALGVSTIDYSTFLPDGGTQVQFSTGGYSATTGDLVYIPWEPVQYSAITNSASTVMSGQPQAGLWYRVIGATGITVDVDRNIPSFAGSSSQQIKSYFYPFNAIEEHYGSAATVNTRVWNMNIVRTSSVIGADATISGYTTYGSIEYNGTKMYLGFSAETRQIGIVHYSNEFTGNTYAEQLIEKSVKVDIPNIMWHNTYGSDVGKEMKFGASFYDSYGTTVSDTFANTTYRYLRDGTSSSSLIIGRVYHKLKIIVITDPELLAAVTYKSNRNYTLPPLNLGLSTVPKYPLTPSQATGLCGSGYTTFVSYVVSNNSGGTDSYGYPQALHCNYLSGVEGENDAAGNPLYLTAAFQSQGLSYMRSAADLAVLSGTGWNANKVQLLVNKVATSGFTGIDNLDTSTWKLMSSGIGNGIYTGDTTDITIDPLKLQARQFVVSQEDYDSGTTYSLTGAFSAFSMNVDHTFASGVTFGDEYFFYGNIEAGIRATVYKTTMSIYARSEEYNSSNNLSFDRNLDTNTFITEFGVFDNNNNLVAVGKPSYPLKKNTARFLVFQLEIDF